jgi:CubicO group peptidase (beta-lactamase class C family)
MVCLCGILGPSTAFTQDKYAAAIDQYLQAQVKTNECSGVVLVANNGHTMYEKAFGYANREWMIANNPQSKFEIGSLTKQFTAAAILHLVEQGKLRLDDKLSAFYPGYPKGDIITLHMLLNHTSGIVDFTALPRFAAVHTLPLSEDSVIALFKDQPLSFSPGTKWQYSNSGYFLLGCIIEKVSKMPYPAYLEENLIKKAGLKNTLVNRPDSVLANRANGYSRRGKDRWENAAYFAMELPFSAGAMISTAEDLFRWQTALYSGKIISMDMLTKMTTPYQSGYGYALRIDSVEHHLRFSHGGAIPGFTSFLGAIPSKGISIIVLTNDEGNADAIGDALSAALFGLPLELPYKPEERPIDTAILKRYVGRYKLGETTNFELIEKEGKLFLKPAGGSEMELKPESETKFFFARDNAQEFEFKVNAQGAITNYYFINKGSKMEVRRLE